MRSIRRSKAVVAVVATLMALAVLPSVAQAQQAAPGQGPAPEAGLLDGWRQVAAGSRHTCGIKVSGRLYCWGSDVAGQLGNGGANTDSATPVEVVGGGRTWASVSTGNFHTCATKWTGRLFCWGSDFYGQGGNGGTNTDASAPVEVGAPVGVTGGRTLWTSVSAGYEHTCARTIRGRLYCWGNDGSGRLGNDAAVASQSLPVEVAGGSTNWTSVSAGVFHSCATTRSGGLFCWGVDSAGQLGNDAPLVEQHTPVAVAGTNKWADVGAGSSHTCARTRSARLFCWGWDAHGQLGDDAAQADKATPVEVAGGGTWADVITGSWHTCARKADGGWGRTRLHCWGLDEKGALGDDTPLVNRFTPVPVALTDPYVVAITAGAYHTCALTLFGPLRCWGLDSNGQLGDGGTMTDQPTPVVVTA